MSFCQKKRQFWFRQTLVLTFPRVSFSLANHLDVNVERGSDTISIVGVYTVYCELIGSIWKCQGGGYLIYP